MMMGKKYINYYKKKAFNLSAFFFMLKIQKIKQNFIAVAKWEFSKDCTKMCLVGCYQHGVNACGTAVISTAHCCIYLLVLEHKIPFRITDTLQKLRIERHKSKSTSVHG